MAIRIENIRVNRDGPLEDDFELVPGDLNLIYGRNETGKTCLVEAIIRLLFRTGRKAPASWKLTGWSGAGRVTVSGLEAQPVRFTKTGRKLDEYWGEGTSLPSDLSLLLVVRAGETALAEEEDGVGRGILKSYLTSGGLLNGIAGRIKATVQAASIEHGEIHGKAAGELKSRAGLSEDLRRIDRLLQDVEEMYASGDVNALRQRRLALAAERDILLKAKRHRARQLHGQAMEFRRRRTALPDDEELSGLKSRVSVHEEKSANLDAKSQRLEELESSNDDYAWAENALKTYQEITSGRALASYRAVFMLLAIVSIVGAVVAGLLDSLGAVPMIICGALALAFVVLYYLGTRTALGRAADLPELEGLKLEFQKRFGSELTGRPALELRHEKLTEDHIRAKQIREEVDEIAADVITSRKGLSRDFKDITGSDHSPGEWQDVIQDLRARVAGLNENINHADLQLASLDVRPEEHLETDPGVAWDREHCDQLERQFQDIELELATEMQGLEQLRTGIANETNSESLEWHALITALHDKRDEVASGYRRTTAQILAQIQVTTVIKEFREEENARIAAGLQRSELTEPLHALTGHYTGIRLGSDEGLVLVSDQDEEYLLAAVSTGTQEQACIALRIGFASIAMEGQPAFLILDDAFQHSDWNRRGRLVAHTVGLVRAGWQVFYFTMDDHIRELFIQAGEPLGDGFVSRELR